MRRPVHIDGTCPHSLTLSAGLFIEDGVPDILGDPAIDGVEGTRRCRGDADSRCGGTESVLGEEGAAGVLSLFFFLNNEKPMMVAVLVARSFTSDDRSEWLVNESEGIRVRGTCPQL